MTGVPIATIDLSGRHAVIQTASMTGPWGGCTARGPARSDAHRVREVGTDLCGTIVSLNGVYQLLPLNLTVCRCWFNRMTQPL